MAEDAAWKTRDDRSALDASPAGVQRAPQAISHLLLPPRVVGGVRTGSPLAVLRAWPRGDARAGPAKSG